mmetsp:Transcript_35357/g.80810  ORF Transcript_35357/g.80810 Transcript_35357/m.80810 type:complete len:247 (+) Transcript_35357:31-771(+)|eukprot:CAMPEP_0114539052 /NCGR_PEP_ID=MMETSP0114-20121206/34_1 /TAXON_ID=31324 /ORGANISM="Goniomonas sp, Strain m" /LENGTH=246 /DNA_ID=CAMNT_0001723133 /DNA_START=24 /DNA_END=761 /DNA_ORIENTATION=-
MAVLLAPRILLVVALMAQLCSICADSLLPTRLHLVEVTPEKKTFFFRGNEPVHEDENSFAYTQLVQNMQRVAARHGEHLPADFLLVDVSFLNPTTASPDEHDLEIEENFAKTHKNSTYFVRMTLLGDKVNPLDLPEAETMLKARTLAEWQVDRLPQKIERFRPIIDRAASPKPMVVYAHCEQGIDRTGEFVGAYSLRWMNKSWADVVKTNYYIGGRNPMQVHFNSLMWYCLHLKDTGARPDLQCAW